VNKQTKIEILLFLILTFNIILRIPSLFDPVSYGDECIYLTLGQAFNKGLVFYRDIHDNKPPFLYLIAALAQGNLPYFRLITILWNTINVLIIYKIARHLLNKRVGILASFLFSIFSLLPEGRIANGEIFMIMPASLGVLIALIAKKQKKSFLLFLSGLTFSFAFLFKIPIAFDFLGFLVAIFIFSKKRFKDFFKIIKDKNVYLAIIGFLLPILLSIIYYAQKGAFTPYVRSALLQNIGYLSSWKSPGCQKSGLVPHALILAGLTSFLYVLRKKLTFSFYFPALMASFGLYGVFLSQRPYPHYLIEITPWLSLFLAVLFISKKKSQLVSSIIIIALIITGVFKFKYWWYPHLPYYKNFLLFSLKKINKKDYFNFFGEETVNNYQIAYYLQQNSQPKDRIFIWGDGACIYSLSQRLPVGRYTINYHIFDFNGFKETVKAIQKQQPKFIIKLKTESRKFPELDKILKQKYLKINSIGNGIIFKRLSFLK